MIQATQKIKNKTDLDYTVMFNTGEALRYFSAKESNFFRFIRLSKDMIMVYNKICMGA